MHMNTFKSYTYTTQEQPPETTLPDFSIIGHLYRALHFV
jgi:hypothetical protein